MTTTETKRLPEPGRDEIRIEAVLQAIGEPVRLQIVRLLATEPDGIACGEIELPVGASTRAHHLRTLREAGVISTEVEGTRRISSLRRDELDQLYPGLLGGILAARPDGRSRVVHNPGAEPCRDDQPPGRV